MATKRNYKGKYYRIRRTINGRQKAFYGTSKLDAEKQYREYIEQLASDKRKIDYPNATFGELAEDYIENVLKVSQKYAKGTITSYVGHYQRHIKDTWLDDKLIKDVRPSDIQAFYNSLEISQHGIKELNKFMSGFAKWLRLNGCADDFISPVQLPKKEDTTRHNEIVVWEDKEIREILRSMNHVPEPQSRHRQFFLVHLMFYSGLRISEALGLKYSDIRDGVIHVERQYYLGELKEPKWNSKRDVPMHHKLEQAFKAHKRWHEEDMLKNGYETDFVFTTKTGQLYHPSSVRKALERFYRKRNIPYKHIHAYRATFCTQMCRCGVPLEVTSKLMGHKSLEVTAAHYALIRQDTQQEAIDKLKYNHL